MPAPLTLQILLIRSLLIAQDHPEKHFVAKENIEPKIPDYYLINTSLSKSSGPYNYKIGINNLTNEKYYDYAISSTFHDDAHYGLSNVYPLPERNYFVDFKYTF